MHLPHDVVVPATEPVAEIGRDQKKEKNMQEQTTTVTDPVCGMMVDPATATSIEHEGHTYYFCCKGCAKTFAKDPGAYLKATGAS
ncbi:MAG: YHS domain-containing protein [Actinomycetota bacterium]